MIMLVLQVSYLGIICIRFIIYCSWCRCCNRCWCRCTYPEGNHLIAVIFYCVGMALFTMIMGNGFAAFAVITVGIGYPFLIAQGAKCYCCWCFRFNCRLLWYINDSYGCKLQYHACCIAGN